AVLMVGLFIYGLGIALMVRASIGIAPWDVLAQGISKQLGITYGVASIIVSATVMLAWIPLKVRVGVGSVLNAICIGLFTDLWLPFTTTPQPFALALLQYVAGMLVVAFATGMYISGNLGMGPRDGLVMGTKRRFNKPVWLIRTVYESLVLLVGWLLGGQVGLGTVLFAFGIGYLMQLSLRIFKVEKKN
ncbi:MAG: hypothetical protein RL645_1284, partial [Actinomycetota bacterium]